jgi:hypothetical protein
MTSHNVAVTSAWRREAGGWKTLPEFSHSFCETSLSWLKEGSYIPSNEDNIYCMQFRANKFGNCFWATTIRRPYVYISLMYHMYLICISHICISHVYLISHVFLISHVYLMYISCISHVYLMYISCISHVYLICIICISHMYVCISQNEARFTFCQI